MRFEETKVLHKCGKYWDSVLVEAVEINTNNSNLINRDQGFQLSKDLDTV